MTALDRDWLADHPLPLPEADTDKNKRGRMLIAGGSAQVPGALRLTGEAALRAGAGKLQLATVASAASLLGMAMPEAAVFPLAANPCAELGAGAGPEIAKLLEHCDALVLGPGMGAEADAEPVLAPILAHPRDDFALLLDAAAIPAAATMADAVRAFSGRVVLTPHPGEMARLMQCDDSDVTPELAQHAADRFDAILVLKQAETCIAAPGERPLHYPGGGPGLATGGSGDVLAGIIGGLLARGASPRIAAAWGVWLHGEAGRRLAARIGPLGFLARELPAEIPSLMTAPQPAH
jgi:ADP-dependent NAD(P)H-hydrate dehydratase